MELRTELQIDRPPHRVWEVLTDFSKYHEWNPFITNIKGDLSAGSRLEVTLSPPEGRELTVRPTVTVANGPNELRWLGHLWFKGLFDGEHFVHGENFQGVLVRFVGQTLTRVARGFVYMNQALKKRVEG
jgi:hypothetical protein